METFLIILLVLFLAIILLVLFSIRFLGGNEMGIAIHFGKWMSFKDSGITFVLRLPMLECRLARYPKKTYNLDYPERKVITKEGYYGKKDGQEVLYGSLKLTIDTVVYLNFPRAKSEHPELDKGDKHPLVKIYEGHIPITENGLKDWTEEAVVGTLRSVFSKMVWRDAVENMDEISKAVNAEFQKIDGPFCRAGFRSEGIKVIIVEIKVPKDVEEAFSQIDKAKLALTASSDKAKKEAIQTIGKIIKMMAHVTGEEESVFLEKIKKDKKLQKTFLDIAKELTLKQMYIEGGSYANIEVQGSQGIEHTLLNLIAATQLVPKGGKRPEDRSSEKKSSNPPKPLTDEQVNKMFRS